MKSQKEIKERIQDLQKHIDQTLKYIEKELYGEQELPVIIECIRRIDELKWVLSDD